MLAGLAIEDHRLWNFIRKARSIERDCFGRSYRERKGEIKAKKFLKKKTFKLASQLPPIPKEERRRLAKELLDDGRKVSKRNLTALAQAKLDYVMRILALAHALECKVFASVIGNAAALPKEDDHLRTDYIRLFEAFFHFLKGLKLNSQGILVFDELDHSVSYLLIAQMEKYFTKTKKGKRWSCCIIPEPLFVHSDLTTGIQVVDFIAYIISWNFRTQKLDRPKRQELDEFLQTVNKLDQKGVKKENGVGEYHSGNIRVI